MQRSKRLLLGAAFTTVACALMASPAGAQGACSATANGGDVRSYDTPSNALEVPYDGSITIVATAPGPGTYNVDLEVAGQGWTAESGDFDESGWSDTVAVADYSDHSGGLHKVVATSTNQGGTCAVTAYVNVTGKSLFGTTVGIAATGAAVVGLASTVVAAKRASSRIDDKAVGKTVMDWVGGPESDVLDKPKEPTPVGGSIDDVPSGYVGEMTGVPGFVFCSTSIVVAAALTLRAMASDAGHEVVALIGRIGR